MKRFGVSRPMYASDINGAWLVVVIRPSDDFPEPTARHIDTYKIDPKHLPEDPTLIPKLAADLRDLADELESRGWHQAFKDREASDAVG